MTRLLDVLIDETAIGLQLKRPEMMAGQLRHPLALAGSPHATVHAIPGGPPLWETRVYNFDILSAAGTTDRIGVSYTILGAQLAAAANLA